MSIDFPALYDLKGLEDPDFNVGYAFSAGTGIELIQTKKFALDLQSSVQFGSAELGNDARRNGVIFKAGIGFNWY